MSALRPSSASVRRPCSKIDRDQRPLRAEPVGDQASVPGGAERAVDSGLPAAGVERLDELARQDRDVCARHVKQDGQEKR
jgi:hypothetical protein